MSVRPSVASNLTAAVTPAPSAPANTSRPTVSAPSATVGSTITGSVGSWGGTQPISYSFNWNRCDSTGNHCQTIANASAQTYTLTLADAGSTIAFVVTGSNSAGSSVAVSAPTPLVTSQPAGAIRLANGRVSIPASSVSLPHRLVISAVHFSRRPLHSRHAFTGRFRITDTRGYLIRGARVRAVGIPYGWITHTHEVTTGTNGYAVITFHPTRHLPLRKGATLVLAIRARKPGDNTLAGVTAHRLVRVALAPHRR